MPPGDTAIVSCETPAQLEIMVKLWWMYGIDPSERRDSFATVDPEILRSMPSSMAHELYCGLAIPLRAPWKLRAAIAAMRRWPGGVLFLPLNGIWGSLVRPWTRASK